MGLLCEAVFDTCSFRRLGTDSTLPVETRDLLEDQPWRERYGSGRGNDNDDDESDDEEDYSDEEDNGDGESNEENNDEETDDDNHNGSYIVNNAISGIANRFKNIFNIFTGREVDTRSH
jgi:hypothetical protein